MVDDNAYQRLVVSFLVQNENINYNLVEAPAGQKALDIAKSKLYRKLNKQTNAE
jgi:CheY-like chemotaxis protein